MNLNLKPHELAAAMRVLDHELQTKLPAFIRKTFATVSPGNTFIPNWRVKAIAYALEQVAAGEVKRLIILMPPRHLKSVCASIAFPALLLGRDPTREIICVSYAEKLASTFCNRFRDVMQSSWYKRVFPATQIDARKNTEYEVKTTAGGSRLATSTGGVLTGRGADVIIIDDPIKPQDAQSEACRDACAEWFSNTLVTRLNDKTSGAIVVVMQRAHVDDLAGRLMQGSDWTVLSLPAIAETATDIAITGRFHHRNVGDLLNPEFEPLEVLEKLKAEMGSFNFTAQYQQAPVPAGGNMIKWEWFGFYGRLPDPRDGDIIVQSWDTASKTDELSSYSVGITARIDKTGTFWVLDVVRGR